MIHINIFIGEVKKQLAIRGWKYKELSQASGYAVRTIRDFMYNNKRNKSENVKKAIAKALEIEI